MQVLSVELRVFRNIKITVKHLKKTVLLIIMDFISLPQIIILFNIRQVCYSNSMKCVSQCIQAGSILACVPLIQRSVW